MNILNKIKSKIFTPEKVVKMALDIIIAYIGDKVICIHNTDSGVFVYEFTDDYGVNGEAKAIALVDWIKGISGGIPDFAASHIFAAVNKIREAAPIGSYINMAVDFKQTGSLSEKDVFLVVNIPGEVAEGSESYLSDILLPVVTSAMKPGEVGDEMIRGIRGLIGSDAEAGGEVDEP